MGKYNKKNTVLSFLEESRGVVSYACKKAGITRMTFYNWYNKDPKFKERVNDISEENIDVVESKLLQKIQDNDLTAIIFYLKTKGRKRGYVERTEVDQVNPMPNFKIEVIDKREDVLKDEQ